MARAIALTIPLVYRKVSKLGTKNIARLFWLFVALALVGLSVLYIYQVVSRTTGEYSLRKEESLLLTLRAENKELVTQMAQANSLNNLASLVEKDLGFEQVNTINYIKLSNNQIVEREK